MMIGAISFSAASASASSTVGNGTLNRIVPSSVSGMRGGEAWLGHGYDLLDMGQSTLSSSRMLTVTYVPVPAWLWIAPRRASLICSAVIPEVLADRTLELPEREHPLHQPGRAHGMPAGDQPAAGVDRAHARRTLRPARPSSVSNASP